jgi:hypothetical protein
MRGSIKRGREVIAEPVYFIDAPGYGHALCPWSVCVPRYEIGEAIMPGRAWCAGGQVP